MSATFVSLFGLEMFSLLTCWRRKDKLGVWTNRAICVNNLCLYSIYIVYVYAVDTNNKELFMRNQHPTYSRIFTTYVNLFKSGCGILQFSIGKISFAYHFVYHSSLQWAFNQLMAHYRLQIRCTKVTNMKFINKFIQK